MSIELTSECDLAAVRDFFIAGRSLLLSTIDISSLS